MLRAAGWHVAPSSPPRSLAQLVQQHMGPNDPRTPQITAWLLRLETLRYARAGGSVNKLTELQREFTRLPWPRKTPSPHA